MGYFNYLYYYNWSYILFMLPCIILTIIVQVSMNSTFRKYSNIRNSRGLTGAQAAQRVLMQKGVSGVTIEHVSGNLTDHFDPRTNVIRLSDSVYNSDSIAAVGVACHEAGHAVQHAEGYIPNKIRSAILPVANLGSRLSWILIFMGLVTSIFQPLLYVGIILFSASVLFTLATLPVESSTRRQERLAVSKKRECYQRESTRAQKERYRRRL